MKSINVNGRGGPWCWPFRYSIIPLRKKKFHQSYHTHVDVFYRRRDDLAFQHFN